MKQCHAVQKNACFVILTHSISPFNPFNAFLLLWGRLNGKILLIGMLLYLHACGYPETLRKQQMLELSLGIQCSIELDLCVVQVLYHLDVCPRRGMLQKSLHGSFQKSEKQC